MPDIRYVCISDMHLGEEESVLTNLKKGSSEADPLKANDVMKRLVYCLRYMISKNKVKKKPVLILSGDILEMALATTNTAAMVFERFIELTQKPGQRMFSRIVYIPGNHDHHMWELARETHYVEHISNSVPAGQYLPAPWHTTRLFVDNDETPLKSYFLSRLIKRHPGLKNFSVEVAYPNYGLFREKDRKCVVFTHGHYIEWFYHLMTILRAQLFPKRDMPANIWEIEAENFAWIDFFWSTLGRSWEAGEKVEMVYDDLHDAKGRKRLARTFAKSIAKNYDIPLVFSNRLEELTLRLIADFLLNKASNMERTDDGEALSSAIEKGLKEYVDGPLKEQIISELGDLPLDMTVVFGHTHKPFTKDIEFAEFPGFTNVLNTGGWVVDTTKPRSTHGGSIVLIDENLDPVAVRMYKEKRRASDYKVDVFMSKHRGEDKTPFFLKMEKMINPDKRPWKAFSEAAAEAVSERTRLLKDKIDK